MLDYLTEALRFFSVEKVVTPFQGYNDDTDSGPWVGKAEFHPPLPTAPPFGLEDQLDRHLLAFVPGDDSIGTLTFDVATGKVAVQIDWGANKTHDEQFDRILPPDQSS